MAFFVFSSPLFERYALFTSCSIKLGLWLGFACKKQRSKRDLGIAALLALVLIWLEHLPCQRAVLLVAVLGNLGLLLLPRSRLVATRLFLGLLALGQLYGQEAVRILPMQALLLCVGLTLELWRRCFSAEGEARAAASGVALAFAGYLLLWPTVGMRFSGIDFPVHVRMGSDRPLRAAMVVDRARHAAQIRLAVRALARSGASHVSAPSALLGLSGAVTEAVRADRVCRVVRGRGHSLLTNGALEILAELALLLLVSALAWPSPLRAFRRSGRQTQCPTSQRPPTR